MFVKPAEGRVVRRPDTLVHLLPDGEDVPDTEFWVRRLRDGDVVAFSMPVESAQPLEERTFKDAAAPSTPAKRSTRAEEPGQ